MLIMAILESLIKMVKTLTHFNRIMILNIRGNYNTMLYQFIVMDIHQRIAREHKGSTDKLIDLSSH